MLVLSRRKEEIVRIGDIKVMVVDIQGDKISLGIEAPKNVPVHREEVYQAIQKEKQNEYREADCQAL